MRNMWKIVSGVLSELTKEMDGDTMYMDVMNKFLVQVSARFCGCPAVMFCVFTSFYQFHMEEETYVDCKRKHA